MAKAFHVNYSKTARKALLKMDAFNRMVVLSWIEKNLVGCINPRQFGRGLAGNMAGAWRYRIGDFRVIADIQDENVLILVLAVGKRRDIY